MTPNWAQLQAKKKLLIAYVACLIMVLNSIYIGSSVVGVAGLSLFVLTVGIWLGKIYGRHISVVNFLIGCFVLLSLNIIFIGIVVYLMIFSAIAVWIFLASIPIACQILEKHLRFEEVKQERIDFSFNRSLSRLGLDGTATAKIAILAITVLLGSIVGWLGRTGNGISHIGQVVSYVFWPILGFSFFMLYLVWRENKLTIGLKLVSMFLAAFLVFGAPLIVYANYITEDSFGLLGVVKSIMQTGVYGWSPHLARTGYFAITSLVTFSSSTQLYVQEIHKLLTPMIVSIYAPLFVYLLLEKITKKKQTFAALVSILLFPTFLFISVPLEKSIATVFFLASLWLSFLLLENSNPRKIEILILSLVLLSTPFLHDYFGMFAVIPLILGLFLRLSPIKRSKRSFFLLAIMLCFTALLIPSSFVIGSYVSKTTMAATFSAPKIDETINFLMPAIKMPASSALDGLVYLYSDNFMWIRYALLVSAVLVLRKSTLIRKNQKTKIWLIITVLAFWLGYFLLKTSVQNPPEAAKDYRFGLFVDLSLIPLAGIILIEVIEKMKCVKIQLRLPRVFKEPKFSSKLPQFTVAIVMILIMTIPVYCGFNFDRIMERPFEAQGFGRYVVTDDKLQVMQYIQNKSGFKKSVILTDSHMGQIAQGALDMNFEKAKLFNLNSGAALYLYFNNMRRNPSIATMGELMNQTNAGIGFFVIGLNDWRGWLSQDAYWIDSNAIESLKVIANEWKVFGEKNDMFVFVFQKP